MATVFRTFPSFSMRPSSIRLQLSFWPRRFAAFFLLPLQVVYPVFVVGMMCRVIFSRVRPDAGGMAFTLTKKDRYYTSSGRRCQRFFSRVLKGVCVWGGEGGAKRKGLHTHDGYL